MAGRVVGREVIQPVLVYWGCDGPFVGDEICGDSLEGERLRRRLWRDEQVVPGFDCCAFAREGGDGESWLVDPVLGLADVEGSLVLG